MKNAELEFMKLKAMRQFGGALCKSYQEWTQEERRACAILDRTWRMENGLRETPGEDAAHFQKLGKKLYRADETVKEDWRASVVKLGGEWMRPEREKYHEDPRFIRKLFTGCCKLWDSFRESLGFGKTDDVSPFEAIRADKVMESGLDFEAEMDRIKADYALPMPKGTAAHDRKTLAEKDMKTKDLAKMIYMKTFVAALEKPYSSWTMDEKRACMALDAIWRMERGHDAQPGASEKGEWDFKGHWEVLGEKIKGAKASDLNLWKSEIAACGGAAMKGLAASYAQKAGFWKTLADRLAKAWDRFRKAVAFEDYSVAKDISPFEAIRAQKVLDDPKITMEQAAAEITAMAGQTEKAPEKPAVRTRPESAIIETLDDGRFDGKYKDITSQNYNDFYFGDQNGTPMEFRITGPGGSVRVRAMEGEDGCLNAAIKSAYPNMLWDNVDRLRSKILKNMGDGEGFSSPLTQKNGEKSGEFLIARGEEAMQRLEDQDRAKMAAFNEPKECQSMAMA